jgi:hypothetical protein
MKKKTKRADGQTTLTISLPSDLKKAIEDAAVDEQRSTSNFLVVELAKLVAQHAATHTPKEQSRQDAAG